MLAEIAEKTDLAQRALSTRSKNVTLPPSSHECLTKKEGDSVTFLSALSAISA